MQSSKNTTTTSTSSGPKNVRVSWTANSETAVNSAGGGYKLYYSSTAGFSVPGGTMVNIPYVSGSSAPHAVTLTLAPGVYYFRVAAYSSLTALSTASGQLTLTVP